MITHEKIYKNRLEHNYDIEIELSLNASIYIQLPTYDDYNEFQIFRNFVNTINDQVSKEKLLQNYGLCNDYGEIIKKLNLIDDWNHFNECAFNKFVKKWCYENNIEI